MRCRNCTLLRGKAKGKHFDAKRFDHCQESVARLSGRKAGYTVDFASPKGGYTPIDPHSLAMAEPVDEEFYQNKAFMHRLGTTLAPSAVNPTDYACIYYAGGHGVVWDFPDNAELQAISRKIYESGGIVSSVCHGAGQTAMPQIKRGATHRLDAPCSALRMG